MTIEVLFSVCLMMMSSDTGGVHVGILLLDHNEHNWYTTGAPPPGTSTPAEAAGLCLGTKQSFGTSFVLSRPPTRLAF